MAWTYDSNFPELSNDVQKDSSTPGRFTFERKMYFKPDSYEKWASGSPYVNGNYSAQLVTHPAIPKIGDKLGSLPGFYLADIVGVSNLNSDDAGEAVSYGVVTLLYENKKPKGGASSSGNSGKKPWDRHVEDFTISNQEISVPFTEGYLNDTLMPVQTTVGQPIYDFTTSIWVQRCTWTFCDKGSNYFISSPIINQSQETLFSKIIIPKGCGLLLPPSYRKLYWQDGGTPEAYDEWTFEIIVNGRGHAIPILNAGTKIPGNEGLSDLCSWYISDPSGSTTHEYGDVGMMLAAKAMVDAQNAENPDADPSTLQQFVGDVVQSPVPLDEGGNVLEGGEKVILPYEQYKRGSWKLGVR